MTTGVHICRPKEWLVRRVMNCPTCKTRRRFSGRLAGWYGTTWTCCHCGDSFADGERLPRSNARGWRMEEAKRAKANWDAAVSMNDFDWDQFYAEIGAGA